MKISVLITAYNRARNLRNCLHGYLRQTEGDFEIVVSDDGSTDESPDVVRDFAKKAPFRVAYIWRKHDGFRRAEVINRSIAAARNEWLLFTDCDSLPAADLIAVHRRAADPKRLLCGAYAWLPEDYSLALTPEMVLAGDYDRYLTLYWRARNWQIHLLNLWYLAIRKKRRPHNRGVNMSCARAAMDAINGFDHRFVGWGNEDGDVRDRLRRIGVEPKSIYHSACVFHMWHPRDPSVAQRANKDYARRPNIPVRSELGLDSLRGEDFWYAPGKDGQGR